MLLMSTFPVTAICQNLPRSNYHCKLSKSVKMQVLESVLSMYLTEIPPYLRLGCKLSSEQGHFLLSAAPFS